MTASNLSAAHFGIESQEGEKYYPLQRDHFRLINIKRLLNCTFQESKDLKFVESFFYAVFTDNNIYSLNV